MNEMNGNSIQASIHSKRGCSCNSLYPVLALIPHMAGVLDRWPSEVRRGWLVIPCCSPRTCYPFPHSHAHIMCTSRQVGSPFSLLALGQSSFPPIPLHFTTVSSSPTWPFQVGRPPPVTWPIVWTACMPPRGLGALDCEGEGHSVALPSLQANRAALEHVRGLKVKLGRGCCLPGPSDSGVCVC